MLEQILSRSLAQTSTSGASECPSATTLAAWYDRSLGGEELARLDVHLSNCSRCQSILASVALAEEPERATDYARGWRSLLELRFLAPAIAGTLAIVAIAHPFWRPRAQVTVQRIASMNSAPDAQQIDAASSTPAAASSVGGVGRFEATLSTRGSAAPDSVDVRTITPPDHSAEWLIGRGGVIVRRDPSGIHLQPSGISQDLTAGSALSSRLCWVVGRGGTVIRSVDGNHWQILGAPTTRDLVAVVAQSASVAEVATDSGAEYVTTDGGTTWTAR